MKKNITVSGLTFDLWMDYIKPAAIAAGILEEMPARDEWHEFTALVTDETAADEIAHCMYIACMGAGMDGTERTHAEYIRHEAERMIYQLGVSLHYDTRHTADTIAPLLAALVMTLETDTTETTTETTTEPTTTETTKNEEEDNTMFTNYETAVTADVAQYIEDNYTAEEIAEKLEDRDNFAEEINDACWIADEVTGNGSGSYTFSRAKAREYVLADIDTVREALREFCVEADTIAEKFLGEDWKYFDVTARCYVLGQAIEAALDALESK